MSNKLMNKLKKKCKNTIYSFIYLYIYQLLTNTTLYLGFTLEVFCTLLVAHF